VNKLINIRFNSHRLIGAVRGNLHLVAFAWRAVMAIGPGSLQTHQNKLNLSSIINIFVISQCSQGQGLNGNFSFEMIQTKMGQT